METGMTVKEAAQLLGKTEQFVRCGLQQERLPFGSAVESMILHSTISHKEGQR